MIVYRLAVLRPHGWENQWFPDYREAVRIASSVTKAGDHAGWQIERMTIPTDRLSLCEALNQAHDAPANWPGDKVHSSATGRRRR